jgi:predicted Zn-dependent protease with MMP-like domain
VVIDVSPERFEQLVAAAINVIPADLAAHMDNVAIVIEDFAPEDHPGVLGLYEGIPLTARGSWYVAAMPDRIRIFRIPILQMCSTQADVVREVYITVVHEVGHHFGIDDDRLHELGVG